MYNAYTLYELYQACLRWSQTCSLYKSLAETLSNQLFKQWQYFQSGHSE